MMLRELVVEDLFGDFTHTISFKPGNGLTILHGPNGVGKTTILRLLDSLFNRRFRILRGQPFRALRIEFDNGDRLQIVKSEIEGQRPGLDFALNSMKGGRRRNWAYKTDVHIDIPPSVVEDIVPELVRTGPHEWTVSHSGEVLEMDDVLDRYERYFPVRHTVRNVKPPEWLDQVLSRVPVYFIQADRLSTTGRELKPPRRTAREVAPIPTVAVYASELAEQIRRALANYGDSSQMLDSTFPARFLQSDSQIRDIPPGEEIRERYGEEAERRNGYVRTGLLDAGDELQLPDRALDAAECRVLDTYLRDVDLKLDKLDDLAEKLELFLSIVNGKFRRKSIRVDREYGLRAGTSGGQPLDLTSLSSGEQQEIVLAYGLLFRERPGTMILLDEPELSLHVTWQLDLIPDLLKVADLAKLEFLITTHSPQIINDRWDLTVDLSDQPPK